MERRLNELEGAFPSKGFTFVCEGTHHDVDLPGSKHYEYGKAQELLLSAGNLPELAGAPVASWVLARIARLAGKRFPYTYGQVAGEAARYWVRYFVVSESGKPIGILLLSGNAHEIRISLRHSNNLDLDPEQICQAFLTGLLEKPTDVARCRVVSVFTELIDIDSRFAIPRVYGWDGKRFLNETAPEHAPEAPGDYD
jgi:hypothetical protein